jgi:AcrR family transcriptional regulator
MTQPATPTLDDAPRWRRRKDARPQEILEAALDVFVRQGFAATRVQDIARQAGITIGTLYLYFPSKEALFHAAVMQAMTAVLVPAEERVSCHQGAAEPLLVELMRRWWKTTADPRFAGIPKLVGSEADKFPDLARVYVHEVLHRARALYARVLQRGIESGEFRSDLNVGHAVRLAMAPIQYASIFNSSLRPFDTEDGYTRGYVDTHLEIFLRGIRAPGRTPP